LTRPPRVRGRGVTAVLGRIMSPARAISTLRAPRLFSFGATRAYAPSFSSTARYQHDSPAENVFAAIKSKFTARVAGRSFGMQWREPSSLPPPSAAKVALTSDQTRISFRGFQLRQTTRVECDSRRDQAVTLFNFILSVG
jgi:hypothetical protein